MLEQKIVKYTETFTEEIERYSKEIRGKIADDIAQQRKFYQKNKKKAVGSVQRTN